MVLLQEVALTFKGEKPTSALDFLVESGEAVDSIQDLGDLFETVKKSVAHKCRGTHFFLSAYGVAFDGLTYKNVPLNELSKIDVKLSPNKDSVLSCVCRFKTGFRYDSEGRYKERTPSWNDIDLVHVRNVELYVDDGHRVSSVGSTLYFVKTLTGTSVDVFADPFWTIERFKEALEDIIRVPADQQRLIFAGKPTEDWLTLAAYKIPKESTLHLVMRLRGGMYVPSSGREDYAGLKTPFGSGALLRCDKNDTARNIDDQPLLIGFGPNASDVVQLPFRPNCTTSQVVELVRAEYEVDFFKSMPKRKLTSFDTSNLSEEALLRFTSALQEAFKEQ